VKYEKLKNSALLTVIGHMTDASEGAVMIDKSGGQHPLTAQGWSAFEAE
jgi:thiamine-monophosphate kinase